MFMQDIPLESEVLVHTTLSPKSVSSLPLFCMCGFMCRCLGSYVPMFWVAGRSYYSKGIKKLKKLMTSFLNINFNICIAINY